MVLWGILLIRSRQNKFLTDNHLFFKNNLDGSYDDLLKDDDVQCVYVGNLHFFRREIGEKCLLANKHVLLEKPFACNPGDAEYLINLAKEKKLFIMEVSVTNQTSVPKGFE